MERYDVSEGARLSEMVEAAERGEDVEIVREGAVVARLVYGSAASARAGDQSATGIDWDALDELHRSLPPDMLGGNAGEEVSRMRDEYDERLLRR